jgi:hypothetical protein
MVLKLPFNALKDGQVCRFIDPFSKFPLSVHWPNFAATRHSNNINKQAYVTFTMASRSRQPSAHPFYLAID